MQFGLSCATLEDVAGIIDIRFQEPGFPNTSSAREWYAESFRKGILDKELNTVCMIVTEDPDIHTRGRVVSFARWIIHPGGGPVPDWTERWVSTMAEGMSEDSVAGFFEPMARQHAAITKNRPHYCKFRPLLVRYLFVDRFFWAVLEAMYTHKVYRRHGLASILLKWGCDGADRDGLECYLDANLNAMTLYKRFGFVEQKEHDSHTPTTAMLRPAKNPAE
jgi:GNAT superfamily N-acetyltransferase